MRNTLVSSLFFLAVLLSLPAISSSQDFGIGGIWYHNNMQTHINVRDFTHVVLINENGDRAVGHFIDPWQIKVPGWNVVGNIQNGGTQIAWSNNTSWTRYPSGKTHISGTWYHNNRPTSIQVYDNGWRFSITNENGQTSDGYAKSSRELYIPSLGISGYVNEDATKIRWTNGTVWTRNPHGSGPLSSPEE
jgi:hypothetical protein